MVSDRLGAIPYMKPIVANTLTEIYVLKPNGKITFVEAA
jgi:hypothetical protein